MEGGLRPLILVSRLLSHEQIHQDLVKGKLPRAQGPWTRPGCVVFLGAGLSVLFVRAYV